VRWSDSFPYLAPPNREPAVAGRGLAVSKVADQIAFLEEAGEPLSSLNAPGAIPGLDGRRCC
jgi:hypothetical protein